MVWKLNAAFAIMIAFSATAHAQFNYGRPVSVSSPATQTGYTHTLAWQDNVAPTPPMSVEEIPSPPNIPSLDPSASNARDLAGSASLNDLQGLEPPVSNSSASGDWDSAPAMPQHVAPHSPMTTNPHVGGSQHHQLSPIPAQRYDQPSVSFPNTAVVGLPASFRPEYHSPLGNFLLRSNCCSNIWDGYNREMHCDKGNCGPLSGCGANACGNCFPGSVIPMGAPGPLANWMAVHKARGGSGCNLFPGVAPCSLHGCGPAECGCSHGSEINHAPVECAQAPTAIRPAAVQMRSLPPVATPPNNSANYSNDHVAQNQLPPANLRAPSRPRLAQPLPAGVQR